MPRNHRYITYYEGRRHRYKLVIQPAGDDAPAGWTETILPDNTILFSEPGSLPHFSYGDRPLSLQQVPLWKFTVNLHKLTGGADSDDNGTTDLEDLHYYILSPGYDNGGKLFSSNVSVVPMRTFQTRNLWRLYSDLGDGEEPDTLLFEGVQQIEREKDGKATPLLGLNQIDVEVDHIMALLLQTILPGDIATRTQHDAVPVSFPSTGFYTDRVFDYAWRAGSYSHGAVYYAIDHYIEVTPLWYLFYAIQRLLNDAYISMIRSGEDPRTTNRFKLRSSGESPTLWGGMPYDILTFYKKSYLNDNARGAALDRTAICLIARICQGTSFTSDHIIGGFLSEHNGDASIFAYANAMEFLTRCSAHCKTQIVVPEEGYIDLWFLPVRGNRTGTRTLSIRDVKGVGAEAIVEIPYKQGTRLVGNVQFAVKGGVGDDVVSDGINVVSDGGSADSGPNIELAFHTMPRVGEKSADYVFLGIVIGDGNLTSTASPLIIGAFNPLVLLYVDTPSIVTQKSVFRVHESVTLDVGDSTSIDDNGYLALGAIPGIEDTGLHGRDEWYDLLRAYALASQNSGGLARFTAEVIGQLFNDESQTSYEIMVPIELVLPNYHGEVFEFRDPTGATEIGANILGPPGETKYSGLKGRPHLMTATYDLVNDLAKIELFAS